MWQVNNFKPLKEVESCEQCNVYPYQAKFGITREYCLKYWEAIRKNRRTVFLTVLKKVCKSSTKMMLLVSTHLAMFILQSSTDR